MKFRIFRVIKMKYEDNKSRIKSEELYISYYFDNT